MPILKWQIAPAPTYIVTFSDSVTIGGVSNTTFTLPSGPYTYTPVSGGVGDTFNLVSDGKMISLSPNVTFAIPYGASVEVKNASGAVQTGTDGVYNLPNGTYSYTVTSAGSDPVSGTFVVAGVDRTITIGALAALVEVTFNVPSGAALTVTNASGNVIAPTNGAMYSLAEGGAYLYTISGAGYVGKTDSITVTANMAPITVTLDAADATVTFTVAPSELSATVVVTDGTAIVIPSQNGTYALKSGKTYGYTVSAENYDNAEGTFTASNGLNKTVTLTQSLKNVTFNIQPSTAAVIVKDGETVVPPTSGKTYALTQGKTYSYTVSEAYYIPASGSVTVDAAQTVSVTLTRMTAVITIKPTPAGATVAVHDINSSSNNSPDSVSNGTHKYILSVGATYEYIVSAEGYTDKLAVFTVQEAGAAFDVTLSSVSGGGGSDAYEDNISGGATIAKGGTYYVQKGATGVITVNTPDAVTIVGTGISAASMFSDLTIDCVVPGANLTVRNLYIHNDDGLGTSSGATDNGKYILNFKGAGNTLRLDGVNFFEKQAYVRAAGIHVPKGASLVIEGPGTLYMYKYSQGAGIGGDSYEASGSITFAGGEIFIKGSKTGPLIGGDAGATFAPGESGEYNGDNGAGKINDPITITGGTLVLVNKAQGAAIGASHLGSCAGDVYLTGGNLTIVGDFNASAIGRGGGNPVPTSAGYLYVSGGSFKAMRTANSYYALPGDNPERAINGASSPAYVDDALVTAEKLNADGSKPVSLLIFDTTKLEKTANSFTVKTDKGFSYSGGLHEYKYAESPTTIANFGYDGSDKNLYFYLPETEQTLTVNNEKFTVKWDASKGAFTV
ncbi:MAG: hypothetical protein LBT26_01010, partial [Clostridiales Family XIII bacterium]|nr:hypothetical protein [Clostridiales Family XIII bacterium]